jgi:plastocyanin
MHRSKVLAIVAAAALVAVSPAATADRLIVISPTGFVPRDVTINVGDTVTWSNTDTRVHQVVVARTTCNLTVQPASTGSCPFRTAGRFNYRDPNRQGPAWRGTITVQAGPLAVTIVAKPAITIYRSATTLSGSVSNGQANERVAVQAQACGSTSFATVGTVDTTTGGAWTLAVRPLNTTVYQARWRSAAATTTVRVRPRVTLRKLTAGRFAVRVLAAQSFSGKVVVFQRFNAARGTWVRVRFVVLRSMGGTAPTFVSGANFRSRVRVGTRVRAVIGSAQVAPCYLAGRSNVVRR